ncbi:hypothetical protein EDB83DRAFT_2553675 [Lactarius deliciosus]|nr:hypothetical protein EDB83DRAFT_2553675 [Lactarius deliciosus]
MWADGGATTVEEDVAADVKALRCEGGHRADSAAPFAVSAVAEDAESFGGIGGSVMFMSLLTSDTEVEQAECYCGLAPRRSSTITITAALSKAVETGTYPEMETRVLRYIPALPSRNNEGMRHLPNRLEILRYLKAFKKYLGK